MRKMYSNFGGVFGPKKAPDLNDKNVNYNVFHFMKSIKSIKSIFYLIH